MAASLSAQHHHRQVARLLFDSTSGTPYAVLDAASIATLADKLARCRPAPARLYRPDDELRTATPYVVALRRGEPFTGWLIEHGWGRGVGIYANAEADLRTFARHCRSILITHDEQRRTRMFRFYHPHVLQQHLPRLSAAQRDQFFGPVVRFIAEDSAPPHPPRTYFKASATAMMDAPPQALQGD